MYFLVIIKLNYAPFFLMRGNNCMQIYIFNIYISANNYIPRGSASPIPFTGLEVLERGVGWRGMEWNWSEIEGSLEESGWGRDGVGVESVWS